MDVAPIAVESVLNAERDVLDKIPMEVERVEAKNCVVVDNLEKLEFVIVENDENPACKLKKFVLITVLKVDIVDTRFVF